MADPGCVGEKRRLPLPVILAGGYAACILAASLVLVVGGGLELAGYPRRPMDAESFDTSSSVRHNILVVALGAIVTFCVTPAAALLIALRRRRRFAALASIAVSALACVTATVAVLLDRDSVGQMMLPLLYLPSLLLPLSGAARRHLGLSTDEADL